MLGEIDDPGMEIEIAVRKYGVPHEFSERWLEGRRRCPTKCAPPTCADRIDLRDVPLVTIDGEDARDFDDAVYCEPVKIGRRQRLAPDRRDRRRQPLREAGRRARRRRATSARTSVYFPRRVIPMLPEKLSNGLCSLNPQVDRLSMVCDCVVTAKGEIKAYQFYPAVIHSACAPDLQRSGRGILGNTDGREAQRRATLRAAPAATCTTCTTRC